ncbi:MAG: CapA family protein [Bacteroides sp.]|nr:CapA family protein [Bacteroides sp.]MCM1412900.1 CapA family protein [Bacteroides sp.]MCM1471569.1 CapA family protein [Bacteroides sp.]
MAVTPLYLPVYLALLSLFGINGGDIDIVFAGDAMMHQRQLTAAATTDGTYDFSHYYSAITPYIASADYAVVNLELPLGGSPYSGYPRFCAPDSYLNALLDAGFDLILNANNHILDRGDQGLRRTIDRLDALSVPHVGAYSNRAERDSIVPLIVNVKGYRIAFLNYTYGTNGLIARNGAVVDYIDRDLIKRDIAAARQKGAELIVVCMHWGEEYTLMPVKSEKEMADFLTEQGVDLIIGGHPHVIQPMEMRRSPTLDKNIFLCYSLGNFISAMRTTDTRGGAMARVTIGRDSAGNACVKRASYRTVFTVEPYKTDRSYRLVDGALPSPSNESERKVFYTRARAIFDRRNIDVPLDTLPISRYQRHPLATIFRHFHKKQK